MPTDPLVLTAHDTPPADLLRAVNEGLDAFNREAAPLHEVRPLACVARSTAGGIVGGAVGRTWGGCAEIQQLWVAPAGRNRGVGGELVKLFEDRARERGCHTFYLETWSFQAPAFYLSLGYTVGLEIPGFRPGITKYVLVKTVAGGS